MTMTGKDEWRKILKLGRLRDARIQYTFPPWIVDNKQIAIRRTSTWFDQYQDLHSTCSINNTTISFSEGTSGI